MRPAPLAASLLGLGALAGCAFAGATAPDGQAPPGAIAGPAVADTGAVEIRVRPALRAPAADRAIAALEGIVAKVRFEISGANVPANTAPIEVQREQFTENRATVRWSDLLPGPVTVRADLFDSSGKVLGRAKADVTIKAGQTTAVDMAIEPAVGAATMVLDVGQQEPAANLGLTVSPLAPGSWQAAPPMAIPRAAHGAVFLAGRVYAVGGDFNNLIEGFEPQAWRWTPQFVPNDPIVMQPVGSAVALGNMLVVVGRDLELGGKVEHAAPIFIDPAAPTWASLTVFPTVFRPMPRYLEDLQAPRTGVGAAADGQNLYMIGGSSRRAPYRGKDYVFVTLGLHESLSVASGQWGLRAPVPTARASMGTAMVGGRLYAAGGFRWKGTAKTDPVFGAGGIDANGATQEVLATLEIYDTLADAWITKDPKDAAKSLAPLPTARHGLALVASGGRLYAIGGATADGKPTAAVESYDPGTNTWRAEPPLNLARALLAATALPDGTILATGGFGAAGAALREVEAFLPGGQP